MTAHLMAVALLAANAPGEFDIRSPGGGVVIAAGRIVSYDWPTHTLTLTPGTRKTVAKAVFGRPGGSTFVAAVGGRELYRGTWKSVVMSSSCDTPVIVLDRQATDPTLGEDQVRIELGYPTGAFFKGEDPRGDPGVKAAVRGKPAGLVIPTDAGTRELAGKDAATYKLAAAWMEERLKEAEAVKPGTTYADLARTFKRDGGISRPTVHRFVSILCPYLKIDVEFEGDARSPLAGDAKVKAASRPYVERPFAD